MVTVTVGIDIGAGSTKVVLGSNHGCEIVRNEIGEHTIPTAISFSGKIRHIGHTANLRGTNVVTHANRLLSGEMEAENDSFFEFELFNYNKENGQVTFEYDGSNRSFTPAAISAMLLGEIRRNALSTVKRISGKSDEPVDVSYMLSIGSGISVEAQQQLLDAAFAAGVENARLVERCNCYSYAYQRKFPEHMDGRVVLIVDMGHSQTTVSVISFGGSIEVNGNEEDKKEDEEPKKAKVLSSIRHKSLGAGSVDIRLWSHFQSTAPALAKVSKNSRSGQRLLEGTEKLKHLLSQLPESSVTVENVGENDKDSKLAASRTLLAELCQPDAVALTELIHKALKEANVETVDAVEAVGGGCRIPWVRATILDSLDNKSLSLSHSLDDTSVALGAALIGEDSNGPTIIASEQANVNTSERRTQLLEAERAMATADEDAHITAETRNKIEAHVLEMRSAKNSKHGSLLPATIDARLDELEDWLFSVEAEEAPKEAMNEKLQLTIQTTNELCKDFFKAVREESEAKEREMEEEAKKAQKERDGEEEGDDDDHDNRRLPKKRRMEIVMKNKTEANELFSDGNYKFAAARYTKALSHCAKFVDLNPDDVTEVNALKLSLNLNLALAYLKLENPDQALRVCNDALAIDENSAKALYRRASIYCEKNNWDGANKDTKKAASLAPDDKAIKKLQDRIDLQINKQKMKEKKMAQKMFS
jgi:molecular chaperone DnaK (HSP70)